ncbi:MAG: T9SS type A sorting domain-containing protein [Crocinitomicaceae bacterium]
MVSQDVSNHSGNFTIDMTDLESGMYVVEVNSEASTEKVRVIKQ